MKKSVLFGLTLGAFISVCALGCSHGSSDPTSDDSNGTISSGSAGVSFNISNAKALAGAKDDSSKSARDATESSKLMKILSDGSVESAITVPDYIRLANVTAVLQAPSRSDIFIVFDNASWSDGYWDDEKQIWINPDGLSQLICVHADGSYDDVLGWLSTDNYSNGPAKYIWCNGTDYSNCIKFDASGNLYYLCYEQSGNSSASVFYQYNPTTNKSRQLTAAIPNINYSKFDVSKDGDYLFVEGSIWDNNTCDNFLKVVPVLYPDEEEFIMYGTWGFSWVYDNYTNYLYLCENTYTCTGGEKGGLSRFSESSDFTDKEFVLESKSGYYLHTYADGTTKESSEWYLYDETTNTGSYGDWIEPTYIDYRDLTATKGGIWGTTYNYKDGNSEYSVIRILDDKRELVQKVIDLPDGYTAKTFISTSTNLFALADIMKSGTSAKSGYQTLFKVASTGGEWTNIFENTPNPNKTNIVSWSASNDGSTIFFSGVRGLNITNGTIDTSTGSYNEISSGTKFSCITALY